MSEVTLGTLFRIAKGYGWADPRGVSGSDGELENYGDISNAHRFARKYKGVFLHCHALKKWMMWDGIRWAICKKDEDYRAAQSILTDALTETFQAMLEKENDATRNNYRHAQNAHRNVKRQDGLLRVAASLDGMSVADISAFDTDNFILGVKNGHLDLRTGELLPPDPKRMVSRLAGTVYDPNAKCERWLIFLYEVFEGDAELIAYIQTVCGYVLTGAVDAERAFFFFGHGANGKSVFANILHDLLDDYATVVGSELLIKNPKGSTSEADRHKSRLPGVRLALINEVGQADAFNDQMLKSITSRERITTRPMYGEVFDFMPTHKTIIRGNHKPVVFDNGEGFWRRMDLIPFTRQFKPEGQDPHLEEKLRGELPGILAWAVRGAMRYAETRTLGERPKRVVNETLEYKTDSDLMGQWIDDKCEVGTAYHHSINGLFRDYKDYLDDLGIRSPAQPTFSKQLRAKLKVDQVKRNGARCFQGVTLKSEFQYEGGVDDL